ncbi:hypothetical protein TWF225_011815 [Orbilia oligospora]|nr:hypothetical protein TWF751_008253 [Orbilia oligospora]KAF3168274.1 hypothetical protein TWF225_011815 [Orbilia oligospora]KAF3251906.1 hypothetical protein TWF217_007890 [Orbilia oligospora]KAF3257000.1 hypothetical protein TWF128_005139 [Orbilia oligospora]KAF3286310.1 hypothetical protein TWF132_008999 [Orbilia oligospora]
MAFLGSPPQTYWPSQFVTDPAFDPELVTDPSAIHDSQQTSLAHAIQPTDNAHHILDPALSDEMPPQGHTPIIFHQTSPHSYAPPPPFETGLPPPPPDQLYSPGRMRPPSAKEMQSQHSGEVVMDDGHGAAYIAPAQHPFLGNGMHHPDMHQPLGQPPQIKFRATPNNPSGGGGHGRRPKMTKEEQMARRRLRTDTDEYRTQERERMRRRRAREKEERERQKREQEEQLRAEDATIEEDDSREAKRQAKVDNRAISHEGEDEDEDALEAMEDEEDEEDEDEEGAFQEPKGDGDEQTLTEEQIEEAAAAAADHQDEEAGDDAAATIEGAVGDEDSADKKETGIRTSARRAALSKTTGTPTSNRAARAGSTKATSAKATARPARGRAAEPEKVIQEVTTTRSGRTTRSALSTPKTVEKKDSPTPQAAPAAPVPLKITTRKQTVTTPASPSSPAISKTRVSLKSLSTTTSAPVPPPTDAKSPSSIRPPSDSKSAVAPVVMLFGYPAGVNPPCEVSSVSVTVESTKTGKICMMTAGDMRRPATPPVEGEEGGDVAVVVVGGGGGDDGDGGEKMEIDEVKEVESTSKEEETEEKPAMELDANGESRKSSSPDNATNGRFSWDLVVQMLKADIAFDPSKDELVGFHHKDPLLLSCDRHLNTAMVMAAKEGVRMPKWYVYEKQQ